MHHIHDAIQGYASSIKEYVDHGFEPEDVGVRFSPIEGLGAYLLQPISIAMHAWLTADQKEGLCAVAQKCQAIALAVLSLPLTCLSYACLEIGRKVRPAREIRTEAIFPKTNPQIVDAVYSLTDLFSRFAEEHGIDYRICAGTALGAMRHGGMIPWDDDADLYMKQESFDRLLALKNELQTIGVLLNYKPDLSVMQLSFTEEGLKSLGLGKNGFIDIFLFEEKGNGKLSFASSFFQNQFPNEWLTKEEWDSQQVWPFGPTGRKIPLWGMSQESQGAYVKRVYGDTCLEQAVFTHHHIDFFGVTIPCPVLTKERVLVVARKPAEGIIWHS